MKYQKYNYQSIHSHISSPISTPIPFKARVTSKTPIPQQPHHPQCIPSEPSPYQSDPTPWNYNYQLKMMQVERSSNSDHNIVNQARSWSNTQEGRSSILSSIEYAFGIVAGTVIILAAIKKFNIVELQVSVKQMKFKVKLEARGGGRFEATDAEKL